MLSRREWLAATAALGAAACAPALRVRPSRRTRTTPATNFQVQTSYPAIAPLGDEVYVQRREQARELLRAARADLLFATSGATNFSHLVGADFGRSERLIALVLPVDGEPLLLAPAFEAERVRRGARLLPVRTWEEAEDPIAKIRDWAPHKATWLVEPRTDYGMYARLVGALREAVFADGTSLFEELRLRKSGEELARMRRAVAITEDAFAVVFDQLEAGMSEGEVARLVAEEHDRRGVEGGALVQFGASSALPHGGPTSAPLRDGTVVLMDGGCSFQGWCSDITRTRWFGGPPPARFTTLYNLVHDAQSAAIARVRPGVAAQEIDRAARAVIAAAGLAQSFTHRLGHGMGMDVHEAAYMVEGNLRPLEPGLVFSVEPGVYLPGEMGVRLEDDVTCTATGAELLSRRAPRL